MIHKKRSVHLFRIQFPSGEFTIESTKNSVKTRLSHLKAQFREAKRKKRPTLRTRRIYELFNQWGFDRIKTTLLETFQYLTLDELDARKQYLEELYSLSRTKKPIQYPVHKDVEDSLNDVRYVTCECGESMKNTEYEFHKITPHHLEKVQLMKDMLKITKKKKKERDETLKELEKRMEKEICFEE